MERERGRIESKDAMYVRVMETMWHHPENDQRPAVLRWLEKFRETFNSVLDVGAGDGYYLKTIKPKRYTAIEPNRSLLGQLKRTAQSLGIETYSYPSIEKLASQKNAHYDAVFLIHALLYLSLEEIQLLIRTFRDCPYVLIYPNPENSVSVAFERYIGLFQSVKRITFTHQLLGQASESATVNTHFRVPLTSSDEELAYLVSHHIRDADQTSISNAALEFVRRNKPAWQQETRYELPQGQTFENTAAR